jgi:uncharacterized membrane protein YkvA (DUF1232 family)
MSSANPRPSRSLTGDVARIVGRLPKYAKLVWLLLKEPSLTTKQRAALMAAVGYSISPVDAIPGIIPVVGQLDDLAVVLFTVRWVLRSLPETQAEQYLSQSGLSFRILEEDLHLVKRSGVRIMKRLLSILGITAIWVLAIGKFAGTKVIDKLKKRT